MVRLSLVVTVAALAFAAAVQAAPDPASPTTAAAATATGAIDTQATPAAPPATKPADRMICRQLEPMTGSRLGVRRVCKTKSQWEESQRSARTTTERVTNGVTDACLSNMRPGC